MSRDRVARREQSKRARRVSRRSGRVARGRRGWVLGAVLAAAWSAVTAGFEARADSLAAVSPTAATGDRDAGSRSYRGCAVCHGVDGAGRADGTFPRIAGQHASVVEKQVHDIRDGRRGNPVMASHVEALTDPREVADIAVYVEGLVPAGENGRGGDADTARGAELYRRDCSACHGERGEGSATRVVPVVAGQHYAYLLRQMRAIAGSRRRNAHPEMVESVFDYPDDDLRAVGQYLAQQPWPRPTVER